MVVPVKSRMVHQDRESAADEHEEEEQIGEVTPANPEGKTMRTTRSSLSRGRRGRYMREAEDRMLHPRQHQGRDDEDRDNQKRSGADPDAKAAILGTVNRLMGSVERNHQRTSMAGSEAGAALNVSRPSIGSVTCVKRLNGPRTATVKSSRSKELHQESELVE
jgi:hypothetical protein